MNKRLMIWAGLIFGAWTVFATPPQAVMNNSVTVRLLDAEGNPGPPVEVAKVIRTDEEWKKQLGEENYRILRAKGTERPFCGALLNEKEDGVYFCAGCDLPLFSSRAKFDSGTGWPSFFQPFAKENLTEVTDRSHGMVRVEILCVRCDGHMGHVFNDGPPPTGLRYCMNSGALVFRPLAKVQ